MLGVRNGDADMETTANRATAAKLALPGDLADHFLKCCKLGRFLTIEGDSRFVITDDFSRGLVIQPAAAAMASIYSRDILVAQAALLPLGRMAERDKAMRGKFERLFSLIEEQALAREVKDSAQAILERGFRETEIKALEAELGDKLSPARQRYRQFLGVVGQLIDSKITPSQFVAEFQEFTRVVAGRLDFGIFSFCIDRMFSNRLIPLVAKELLAGELMNFPRLIRRELITNVLAHPSRNAHVVSIVKQLIASQLDKADAVEIELLEQIKTRRISVEQVDAMLRAGPQAA